MIPLASLPASGYTSARMGDFAPTVACDLRRLIEESGLPLRTIARRAGVSPDVLWRWHSGTSKSLNVLTAESVYHLLTGRTFTRCGCGVAEGKPKR